MLNRNTKLPCIIQTHHTQAKVQLLNISNPNTALCKNMIHNIRSLNSPTILAKTFIAKNSNN